MIFYVSTGTVHIYLDMYLAKKSQFENDMTNRYLSYLAISDRWYHKNIDVLTLKPYLNYKFAG